MGGRQGGGLACARAGAAGGQREHVPPAPLFLQASPLGALKVSRLRPWKEEAEAELLGPRLPGQTSGLPVSVAGCRPGQGQGPRCLWGAGSTWMTGLQLLHPLHQQADSIMGLGWK